MKKIRIGAWSTPHDYACAPQFALCHGNSKNVILARFIDGVDLERIIF